MNKKQQTQYEIEDFENHINLWNIPSSSGIILLQKIVDSIQYNQFNKSDRQLPSVLITGENRDLTARAYINSFQIEDFRECPARFLDNGMNSSQFFEYSLIDTAHLITDIEHLTKIGQSVVWRYLIEGKCTYYNFITKDFTKILQCNGLIVLTAQKVDNVPKSISTAVDHIINTESYSIEHLRQFVTQQLKFCGIYFRGQSVIDEIANTPGMDITSIMQLIKTCIVLLEADLRIYLTVKIVQEAKQLCSFSVSADHRNDDIPF